MHRGVCITKHQPGYQREFTSRPPMALISLSLAVDPSISLESDLRPEAEDARNTDESLRLPPIAITAASDLGLDEVQHKDIASVNEGLLNISRQIVNLEVHGPNQPLAINYDAQNVSSQPPRTQMANVRRPRTQFTEAAAFTFVNMKTTDGKRDWPVSFPQSPCWCLLSFKPAV
jgi:hypothetical protein